MTQTTSFRSDLPSHWGKWSQGSENLSKYFFCAHYSMELLCVGFFDTESLATSLPECVFRIGRWSATSTPSCRPPLPPKGPLPRPMYLYPPGYFLNPHFCPGGGAALPRSYTQPFLAQEPPSPLIFIGYEGLGGERRSASPACQATCLFGRRRIGPPIRSHLSEGG